MDNFFRASERTTKSTQRFIPSQPFMICDEFYPSVEPETRREGSPTQDEDLSELYSALDNEGHDLSMFDGAGFFDMSSSGGSPKRQRPDQLDMNLILNRTVHFISVHIHSAPFQSKHIFLHRFRLPTI